MDISEVVTTSVGGIETACISRKDLAVLIGSRCEQYKGTDQKLEPILVFDNNGHAISIANHDPSAMKLLEQADLIHADGQSVVSFSKWTKGPTIPERTATTDMIHDLPNFLEGEIRHYLLGGNENVVGAAAEIMSEKYANFTVAGHHHGYFSEDDEEALIAEINQAKPDVLWVGLGKPKEQEFCIRNRSQLNVPVIITCGGCYNYITGDYPRAPMWMQNAGLEWLHRAATKPQKLLIRYLTTNPHAIYCVIANELRTNAK